MTHALSRPLIVLFIAALLQCQGFVDPLANGGVSETTNGFTVSVSYPNGDPAANIPARIRPADFRATLPGAPMAKLRSIVDGSTDAAGAFRADSLDSGKYVIEINDGHGLAVALPCSTSSKRGTIDLGSASLASVGCIQCRIPAGLHGDTLLYARIYGLERIAQVDSQTGELVFTDIPAGAYTITIAAADPAFPPITAPRVTVAAAETTVVKTSVSWNYSKTIVLNTTVSGARVAADVYNFPLLVRLMGSNFDFAQAQPDGGDLRFTKADGTLLSHEIERWDPVNRRAEVWVRIDTVFGNDSSQAIAVLYGNPAARLVSKSATVFDTSSGFVGVWHLNGSSGSTVLDATHNRYDGISSISPPAAVAGIIGGARGFDGLSQYITMPNTAESRLNFPENGNYMVSAWAYTDTLAASHQIILSKGDYQYNLEILDTTHWEFAQFKNLIGWELDSISATAKTWTLVTGIRSGEKQYLYINDRCVDSTVSVIINGSRRLTGNDFSIGVVDGMIYDTIPAKRYHFDGMIDEVRVSNVARSGDWIRLCYMNQKEKDALVTFR